MAEQSFSLALTTTIPAADGGNSRRNSMGKASSSDIGEKILPHYLRASTGSCHDFCKYGRQHAFEAKARRPFPRRVVKKPPDDQSLAESQTVEKRTSVVKAKPSPDSKSPSSNSPEIIKREVSTKSVVGQTPLFKEVLVKRMTPTGLLAKSFDSQSSMLREVLAKKKSSAGLSLPKSFDGQSPVSREVLVKKKILTQEVSTKSADSQDSGSSEIWTRKKTSSLESKKNSEVKSSTKSVGSQGSGSNEIWTKTKPSAVGRKKNVEVKSSPSTNKQDLASSSGKPRVSMKQVFLKAKEVTLSAKQASSLKPQLSFPDASRVLGGRKNGDIKIEQSKGTFKIAAKKVQASPRASFSPRRSINGVARGLASPRASLSTKHSLVRIASLNAKKNRGLKLTPQTKEINPKQPKIKDAYPVQPSDKLKESNSDMVQEKTLYVIKMEADNKYVESDHNANVSAESSPPPLSSVKSPSLPKSSSSLFHNEEDEDESEYAVTETEDDTFSEYDETEYVEEAESLEGEHRGRNRKSGIVLSEDKDGNPVKLRFRRGRVIDIQSESNSPRRLKFRRGRVLGDSQNLKAGSRRSFKRRGADGDAIDSKPDSEKVVLRHQDAHGKKDAQGLFNNVIEETASKLVETRKSKVKALVGAFETVISLQDGKPSANAAS